MASVKDIKNAIDVVRENITLNKYKDAVMLCAQVSIGIIEHLVDESLTVSKGYEADLKTLVAKNVVLEETAKNFEMLIEAGKQAYNGVSIDREYAEQAAFVLENEFNRVITIDTIPSEPDERAKEALVHTLNDENNNAERVFSYDEEENYRGDYSQDENSGDNSPVFMSQGGDGDIDFRKKELMRQKQLQKEKLKSKKSFAKIIILLIPVVLLILIAFFVRSCMNSSENDEFTVPTTLETFENVIETTEAPTTLPPETTSEAGYYIVTGQQVNVRGEANSNARVVGRVNVGDRVQVLQFYDNTWALIRYEGREAFISRLYIRKDPSQVLAPELNEN